MDSEGSLNAKTVFNSNGTNSWKSASDQKQSQTSAMDSGGPANAKNSLYSNGTKIPGSLRVTRKQSQTGAMDSGVPLCKNCY